MAVQMLLQRLYVRLLIPAAHGVQHGAMAAYQRRLYMALCIGNDILNPIADHFPHFQKQRTVADLKHMLVEHHIIADGGKKIPPVKGYIRFGTELFKVGNVIIREFRKAPLGRHQFQVAPKVVHVIHILLRNMNDIGSLIGEHHHQPLIGKPRNRLPHRGDADVHFLCNLGLHHPAAARQLVGDNPLPQRIADHFACTSCNGGI